MKKTPKGKIGKSVLRKRKKPRDPTGHKGHKTKKGLSQDQKLASKEYWEKAYRKQVREGKRDIKESRYVIKGKEAKFAVIQNPVNKLFTVFEIDDSIKGFGKYKIRANFKTEDEAKVWAKANADIEVV